MHIFIDHQAGSWGFIVGTGGDIFDPNTSFKMGACETDQANKLCRSTWPGSWLPGSDRNSEKHSGTLSSVFDQLRTQTPSPTICSWDFQAICQTCPLLTLLGYWLSLLCRTFYSYPSPTPTLEIFLNAKGPEPLPHYKPSLGLALAFLLPTGPCIWLASQLLHHTEPSVSRFGGRPHPSGLLCLPALFVCLFVCLTQGFFV